MTERRPVGDPSAVKGSLPSNGFRTPSSEASRKLLVVALAGAAGVVKTTIDVIRQTRQVLCSPAWVPLVGPTNVGETEWIPKPAADASTAADAAGD